MTTLQECQTIQHGSEEHSGSAAIRTRPPFRRRTDLIIQKEQGISGQTDVRWVIKDPLSLRYYWFSEPEWLILKGLDGQTSVHAILAAVQELTQVRYTVSEFSSFLGELLKNELVMPCEPGLISVSFGNQRSGFLRRLTGLLQRRIPFGDPTPLLRMLDPPFRLIWSRRGAALITMMSVWAIFILVSRFEEFTQSLPNLQQVSRTASVPLMALGFVGVKILHELGHLCVARRFGTECHDAGIQFRLMTPMLYSNVSDSWMLSGYQRALISCAGIATELMLASAAMILWSMAVPGPFRNSLSMLIVVCSVGTILINANPLMRFDGYYVLSDLCGTPNLSNRGAAACLQWFEAVVFGIAQVPGTGPVSKHNWITAWGFAAILWRLIMTFGLLIVLPALFAQWGMRIAGQMLAGLILLSAIVLPAIHTAATVTLTIVGSSTPVRHVLRGSIFLLLTGCIVFIPIPRHLIIPAVMHPKGMPIYVTHSGHVTSHASYGQSLSKGQRIAALSDPDLLRQVAQAEHRLTQLRSLEQTLRLQKTEQSFGMLNQTVEAISSATADLQELQQELQSLTIRTQMEGVLVEPPAAPEINNPDVLPDWSGFPLSQENSGAWLHEGQLLGVLQTTSEARLVLAVAASELPLLREGMPVQFSLFAGAGEKFEATLDQISSAEQSQPFQELVAEQLISWPMDTQNQTMETRIHTATATIAGYQRRLPVYQAGLVRIAVEPESLAERIAEFLRTTFL